MHPLYLFTASFIRRFVAWARGSPLLVAFEWVWLRLWRSPVPEIGGVLVISAGVAAMFSYAYLAAIVCYFAGVLWLTVGIVVHGETKVHENRAAIRGLISLIAVCVLALLLYWNRYINMNKHSSQGQSVQNAPVVTPLRPTVDVVQLPTLEQMFHRDWGGKSILQKNARWSSANGGSAEVEGIVVVDPLSKSYHLAYYIPLTSSEFTYNVCRNLAKDYKDTLTVLKQFAGVAIGSDTQRPIRVAPPDGVFTRRVFIYHENDLSLEQVGNLSREYRKQKLTVEFRGPKYFADQTINGGVEKFGKLDSDRIPQGQSQISKPWPENLGNKDLADAAVGLATRIRDWAKDVRAKDLVESLDDGQRIQTMSPEQRNEHFKDAPKRYMKQSQDRQDEYDRTFRADALALRKEVLSRLPRVMRYDTEISAHQDYYESTMQSNLFITDKLADDLEMLANKLETRRK